MLGCVLHPGVTVLAYLTLSYLIIKLLYKLLRGFRVHILSRVWRTNLRKYGEWAVITGATDGIGKGYARELARRGFHIVLLSRTLEKLQKVAKEIEQESGCKVKTIQVDFTGGSEIYPEIEEGLKDLNIGILVNNVGMALHVKPAPFLDTSDNLNKGISSMLNCNIQSMMQMIRIVLPSMVQRKKGLIINISSGFGAHPVPQHIFYSSTKVFMDFFSRGLNAEYRSKGITVQSLMPLFISTKLTQNPESNLLVKTVDDFVWEALNTVGLTHRTSGCLSHAIQSYLFDLLISDFVMSPKVTDLLFRIIAKKEKKN